MIQISATRLRGIQRASRSLKYLFVFLFVVVLLGTLNNLSHPFPPDVRKIAGVPFPADSLSVKIHTLWIVQTVLNGALSLKVLYHLIRLLDLFRAGKIFTAASVAQLRQMAYTMMCRPAAWLIVLLVAAPEIAAAQNYWTWIMPSFPGGSLIGGAITLFVSRIMNEGREMRDEQELVV